MRTNWKKKKKKTLITHCIAESAILDSHCFLGEKRFNYAWKKPEKYTLAPHTKFELNKYVPKHRDRPVNTTYFCVFVLGVPPVQHLVIQTLVSMAGKAELPTPTRTHLHKYTHHQSVALPYGVSKINRSCIYDTGKTSWGGSVVLWIPNRLTEISVFTACSQTPPVSLFLHLSFPSFILAFHFS